MANEITVIRNKALAHGQTEWGLVFYFDLSAPADAVEDADGTRLAVQNSSQLPAAVSGKFSQPQKDAIDNGNAAFLVFTVIQTPGEGGAAFLARVQTIHSTLKASWLAEQKAVFGNQGAQYNAS